MIYGFSKFTMLAAYVLKCLRLVVVISAKTSSYLNKIFKKEGYLILISILFAIILVILAAISDNNFLFVNYLML